MIDELFSYTRKKIDRKSNDIVFYQDGERLLPYKLSSGEVLTAFAAAPESFAPRHLVCIVYGVDYQGI